MDPFSGPAASDAATGPSVPRARLWGSPFRVRAEFAPSGGCPRPGHRHHGLPPRTAEAVTSDHEQATAISGRPAR
jgi:hypothetical protein